MLALRLQKVIKVIIHENQVGFIKGRNICSSIRILDDIIKYADEENIGGVALSLDYKKAFDSLNKDLILEALKQFNFGQNFVRLVETVLNGTQSAVKNAGWLSDFFLR